EESDVLRAPEELQGFILVGDPVESVENEAREIARIKAARRKARQKGPVTGGDDGSGFVFVDVEEESVSKRWRFTGGMALMAIFVIAAVSIFVTVDPFSATTLVKVDPASSPKDTESVGVAMTSNATVEEQAEDLSQDIPASVETPESVSNDI